MLLWASKFATAKIECSFEMGMHVKNTFGGNTYFAGDGTFKIISPMSQKQKETIQLPNRWTVM